MLRSGKLLPTAGRQFTAKPGRQEERKPERHIRGGNRTRNTSKQETRNQGCKDD
jgi:hypothetical protein